MKKLVFVCGMLINVVCYAQIDTSIYTKQMEIQQRQFEQNSAALSNLTANIGGVLFNNKVEKMRELGSINERRAFANKSIYRRNLNKILDADIAQEKAQKMALEKHYAEVANINAQTRKINSETQLVLAKATAPPSLGKSTSTNKEKSLYIEYISDNLYKTDEGELIKTQYCYEYVYSEKAAIINNKLIFKNGKTCDIDKIVNM